MPRLHLLTLFTHNFYWIIQTILANRELLVASNLHIPALDRNNTLVGQHLHFWTGAATEEDYGEISKILEGGGDVLLFCAFVSPDQQKKLDGALKSRLGKQDFETRHYCVFGRPALLYEDLYKHCMGNVSEENIRAVEALVKNMPVLARHLQKTLSLCNIRFMADISEFTDRDHAHKITSRLATEWINQPAPAPGQPLPSDYFLNSALSLRLLNARRVRDNDWPPLNDNTFICNLCEYERNLPIASMAPLENRIKFATSEDICQATRELEALCGLTAGSLDAPKQFLHAPDPDLTKELERPFIDLFLEKLDASERSVLVQRLLNDQEFLTADQLAMQESLNSLLPGGNAAGFTTMAEGEEAPVLTVLTMAYNHEKYIAECMDSVLAQKTAFPVRHLIVDDYSQDGTPQIITEYASRYPSIQPVLLGKNRGRYSPVYELFSRCHSKYAALCDGDDYFINEDKLQTQVDYLENSPHCSMVFHPVLVTFEDGSKPAVFPGVADLPRGMRERYCLADLARGNFIQTNSAVYRWRFADGLPEWFNQNVCPGDWYWHILHAEKGSIGFIKQIMSVYRRHSGALYTHSFTDSVKHRSIHGMAELDAYKVYNAHLKGVYFKSFAELATGVFIDLMVLGEEQNDTTLLDLACFRHPDFARYFLNKISRQLEYEDASSGPREK